MYKIMAPKPQIGQIGTRGSEPGAFYHCTNIEPPSPGSSLAKNGFQYKIMTPWESSNPLYKTWAPKVEFGTQPPSIEAEPFQKWQS